MDTLKSIRKLMTDLLKQHDNDWDKASDATIEILLKDPKKYKTWMFPILKHALSEEVRHIGRGKRDQTFNAVDTCPKGVSGEEMQKDLVEKVFAAGVNLLGMWFHVCKKRLGDTDKTDLQAEITMFKTNARGNDKKREFLNRLNKKLKAKQTVKDKFKEHELQEILRSVHNDINDKWENI